MEKARSRRAIAVIAGLNLLVGCSVPYQPDVVAKRIDSREVSYFNYRIGKLVSAKVGEPIIKVQDFRILITQANRVSPDRTVNIRAGDADITLEPGTYYLVTGTTLIDGERYSVVSTPFGISMGGSWAVLVHEDGSLYPRIASPLSGLIFNQRSHTISDPSVRFTRGQIESVDPSAPYQNFELIYAGHSSSGLSMSYKEFGADNPNAVSYFQNLIYEADAKEITFRNFKIQIDSVTSDAIHVTVLQD